MSDPTTPKRVLPARERRESAAKRRAFSPVPTQTPTPKKPSDQSSEPRQKRKYVKRASLLRPSTPSTDAASPATEEILPTRFAVTKPLPTTQQKQAMDLSSKEYQSIVESAVLAASLYRSRMQWLCDGIFKKYWTKPVKRKGAADVPVDNPDLKSMQRLGNATITIEPHTFDVIFFSVRDPQATVPYYRHPNQHTPKAALPPPPPPPPPQYGSYTSNLPPPPNNGPPPSTSKSSSNASPSLPPPTSLVKEEEGLQTTPKPELSTPAHGSSALSQPIPSPSSTNDQSRRSTLTAPKPKADPVIQMLASRAASNPHLKDLMKVVATSKATPEQLKEFQSHIDELNSLVRKQDAERAERAKRDLEYGGESLEKSSTPPCQPSQPEGVAEANPNTRPRGTTSPTPVRSSAPGAAHPANYTAMASRPPLPSGVPAYPMPGGRASLPAYMTYPPPPRPEPIIKHIVMEFTTVASSTQPASQDRWFFPEYAVLDLRYGGLEMTCSFFVERIGAEILALTNENSADDTATLAGKWKAEKQYYQPVTMTVRATHHRTIETIARAAKSLPVVQDHMKQVMEKQIRAPQEYLVHQLPRERTLSSTNPEIRDFVDSGVELVSDVEEDELKDYYGI